MPKSLLAQLIWVDQKLLGCHKLVGLKRGISLCRIWIIVLGEKIYSYGNENVG